MRHEVSKIEQLRANRRHALTGWLVGGNGNRWPGDDGRVLILTEMQFWPQEIKDAEQARFNELDAIYEREKARLR